MNCCSLSESRRASRRVSFSLGPRSTNDVYPATLMHWPPPLVRMKRTPSVPPPLSPCRYHRFGGGAKVMACGHQVKVSAGRRGSDFPPPPPQPESQVMVTK